MECHYGPSITTLRRCQVNTEISSLAVFNRHDELDMFDVADPAVTDRDVHVDGVVR